MPNGHGGIPWFGSPVLLGAATVITVWFESKWSTGWLVVLAFALSLLFAWRFAFHLHMWDVAGYGGGYTSDDEMRHAKKRFRIGIVIYSAISLAVVLYLVF
jgi:hypothetical protein